ncbi:MAG: T9SS type A sorting domain-containing protein [Flavobacteriales bacterium]|nr:T9SS type A sorting domain-containing protein [Flavobacteriales bacterium]
MKKLNPALFHAVVMIVLITTVAVFVAWSDGSPVAHAQHTKAELDAFRGGGALLPFGQNTYFMASGNCEGCHGYDATAFAMVDDSGTDVNVVDDWRSTMMANSAHDPFWRAKVSHEGIVNPGLQSVIEDKCTSCHAPMGRHEKYLTGGGPYSIAEMEQDPIALDGVSCVPCHIQSADSLGIQFSGHLKFDTLGRPLYGPYDNLFGAPMTNFVGYEPLYGAHINDAGLCAGCHTLQTETVDLAGTPTGNIFTEQATYHEWLNSSFAEPTFPDTIVSCQGCHVPRIDDAVVISANYLFLQGKSPFGLHHFAGANTFMLELLRDNRVALGLSADEVHFDSTIARTYRMLQQNSLLMQATMIDRTTDTAFIDVSLVNLAGHKFPSGYPARRAFLEVVVLDATGSDTIFRSGGWDNTYEVVGHDASWEPHHDVITDQGQAQIYEHVMADVNGDKTTVLLRADAPLKDNRITPLGFSTSHITYDTTLIAGVPPTDLDFNRDALGVEGSGSDIVHYHVPMNGYVGLVQVYARCWYQAAPPRWMEEMFDNNSAPIDTFRTMYEAQDGKPVLVKEITFTDLSVGIDGIEDLGLRIFPNPVRDGQLRIEGVNGMVKEIVVYDLRGREVARPQLRPGTLVIAINEGPGTYLVAIRTEERTFVEKIVAQ